MNKLNIQASDRTAARDENAESLHGRAHALTLGAGYALVVFSVLHIAFFGAVTFAHWPAWLTGALRDPASTGVAADASLAGFWARRAAGANPARRAHLRVELHSHPTTC